MEEHYDSGSHRGFRAMIALAVAGVALVVFLAFLALRDYTRGRRH